MITKIIFLMHPNIFKMIQNLEWANTELCIRTWVAAEMVGALNLSL